MIPVATAVKGVPLLAFVVIAVWLARRRERRWLAAAVRLEVGRGAITPEDMEVLADPSRLLEERRGMRRRAGPRASALLRRLRREQVNLAMIRERTDEGDPNLLRQRAYCRSLRDALDAIPGAAPAEVRRPMRAPEADG
ncbi:MAG: hypothetical protein U0V56_05140 [Actinomycetota bacterium]